MDMNAKAFSITEQTVVATQVAGTTTATITAPGNANSAIVITWICASGSAAPAGAVALTIKEDTGGANTTRFQAELPASATAPVMLNFVRPVRIANGKNAAVSMPTLGGGVTGTITVGYFIAGNQL